MFFLTYFLIFIEELMAVIVIPAVIVLSISYFIVALGETYNPYHISLQLIGTEGVALRCNFYNLR